MTSHTGANVWARTMLAEEILRHHKPKRDWLLTETKALPSKDVSNNWIFPDPSVQEFTYRICLAASSILGTIENTGCSSESSWGWSGSRAVPFLIHSNMSFSSKSKSLSTTSPTFTNKSTAVKTGVQLRIGASEATRGSQTPQAPPRAKPAKVPLPPRCLQEPI